MSKHPYSEQRSWRCWQAKLQFDGNGERRDFHVLITINDVGDSAPVMIIHKGKNVGKQAVE